MRELLVSLNSLEGLMLAIVIFAAGIGIGAAVVQINSILRRGAQDAVTSNGVWLLLVVFAGSATFLLWQTHGNPVLPAVAATLAVSSCLSLLVSMNSRKLLAEVAERRRQESGGKPTAELLGAAQVLQERLRTARQQRGKLTE